MSFKELNTADLRAAAKAFAVDDDEVIDASNAATLRAALVEAGVTWEMYHDMFFPDAIEEADPEPVTPVGVVTSDLLTPEPEEIKIITKEAVPKLAVSEQYLIKMVRDNPLFEIEGFKFTKDHPYALMSAEKAERVLQEEGFRQAMPSEVQEYYS